MKVIYNKRIPFGKSYYAINLFGIIFSKGKLNPVGVNHEYIHTLQQRELLFIFFYVWYIVEWLLKLLYYRNNRKSYESISFEREAYFNQHHLDYCRQRKPYAWLKYI